MGIRGSQNEERFVRYLLFAVLLATTLPTLAQAPEGYLYDEELVPKYNLPNFNDKSREEWLTLFSDQVYGKVPDFPWREEWRRVEGPTEVFNGLGWREQWVVSPLEGLELDVLLYRPTTEAPVFLGMNFYGNQTVYPDPDIRLARGWVDNNAGIGIEKHQATDASRGARASRWPVEMILKRGYGLCTLYYGDVDPDRNDFTDGVHALTGAPGKDEWGSIAAWAWGLSRVNDMLQKRSDVTGVIAIGHSRLGKTALWAGAQDERFAMVVSNDSGCGGAALSKRRFGETVERINESFPHWFCKNFHQYSNREDDLPLDQHILLSLIAPRPLYVASASADLWADPRGEFLSTLEAAKVSSAVDLPTWEMPEPGEVVQGQVSYHLRAGRHDLTLWDWMRFMDAADQQLRYPIPEH